MSFRTWLSPLRRWMMTLQRRDAVANVVDSLVTLPLWIVLFVMMVGILWSYVAQGLSFLSSQEVYAAAVTRDNTYLSGAYDRMDAIMRFSFAQSHDAPISIDASQDRAVTAYVRVVNQYQLPLFGIMDRLIALQWGGRLEEFNPERPTGDYE